MLVAIPPILLALSLFGLFPWSGVNCWQSDIDITSGRVRQTRYLLWIPVQRSVSDSALTRAVSPPRLLTPPELASCGNSFAGPPPFAPLSVPRSDSSNPGVGVLLGIRQDDPGGTEGDGPAVTSALAAEPRLLPSDGIPRGRRERARDAENKGNVIDAGDLPVP